MARPTATNLTSSGCVERADALVGVDVFCTGEIAQRCAASLSRAEGTDRHDLTGQITSAGTALRVVSSFEVACLDAQGHLLGRPVAHFLGGAVRSSVPYSAYLFSKWAGHPGSEPDRCGEALDVTAIVAQARWMVDTYGFGAIKLKGGVFEPHVEADAVHALRDACRGVSAIVHLGGLSTGGYSWDQYLEVNVEGARRVLEAARGRGGASDLREQPPRRRLSPQYAGTSVLHGLCPRSDSYYGVTKVVGEALGSLYHDRYGLDVVCLRIGSYRAVPTD